MCSLTLLCFLSLFLRALSDTPANCSYADIQGTWVVSETQRGNAKTAGCNSTELDYVNKRQFTLKFPDVVSDEFGNAGFWTLVYNQGFEVVITGRKYFMYSKYSGSTSICDQTEEGWSHTVNGMDWACVKGEKTQSKPTDQAAVSYKHNVMRYYKNIAINKKQLYTPDPHFVSSLNQAQNSWKAGHYSEFKGLTLGDMHNMAGGSKSKIAGIPHIKKPTLTSEEKSKLLALPEGFDWRNAHGVSFVSPVRNQGSCGSCYAFASLAMNEARLRIMTNNTETTIFSTQDIVECSQYSQGCGGGFPYLIGGKYAADFGLVAESCNPYKGEDGKCSTEVNCSRTYGFNYRYVGGFYGACNEESMKFALMRGPVAVSFEVYPDFFQYKGGVYHHVEGLENKFNPFEITNHAVLLVGWGVDATAGPYWIVKNSWGENWGEKGFFRIRRGTDECGIESIAVESFPVV